MYLSLMKEEIMPSIRSSQIYHKVVQIMGLVLILSIVNVDI